MVTKLFFQISKEFFDSIYSPYIDETEETIDVLQDKDGNKCEDEDEENNLINYRELLDKNTDGLYYCNLCYIIRGILLFFNPKLFNSKQKIL